MRRVISNVETVTQITLPPAAMLPFLGWLLPLWQELLCVGDKEQSLVPCSQESFPSTSSQGEQWTREASLDEGVCPKRD